MKTIPISVLRLLLVVLISTFMSPGFAWQMIGSHHEAGVTSVLSEGHHTHHESDTHHDDGEGDIDTSHTQIGHQLSHLPAVVFDRISLPAMQDDAAQFYIGTSTIAFTASDPPYKPPRDSLFV